MELAELHPASALAKDLLDKDQKVRLLDKLKTVQLVHRGQKHLHNILTLKNNLLFKRNDPVSDPDDNINIDSPVTTHIHHAPPSSLGKMLLGAGLIATGIGIPAGAWMIASGAKDAIVKPSDPPAVSVPVEKPPERPAVSIGGYELRLGK